MIDRKLNEMLFARLRYTGYIALMVSVALLSFFPLGAFLPKKRRNPAAKNGLPTLVVKEKVEKKTETVQRLELDI